MGIRVLLISVLFCFGSFYLLAQAPPGYQGKRLMIHYDFHFFPALSNPNANGERGGSSFNAKNMLGAEYVISRNSSMGFATGFFKTQGEFFGSVNYSVQYQYSREQTHSLKPEGNALISANPWMIYLSFYSKPLLAPLGWYHRFGLGRINYRVDVEDKESLKAKPDSEINRIIVGGNFPKIINQYRYNVPVFTYSLGKQRILFDRLILRYGMEAGWSAGAMGGLLGRLTGGESFVFNEENYIRRNTRARLGGFNLLSFNLGLGFLAY